MAVVVLVIGALYQERVVFAGTGEKATTALVPR